MIAAYSGRVEVKAQSIRNHDLHYTHMAGTTTAEKPSSAKRGHLIVIEGLDRSGKSTQCQMLCEDIRGIDKEVKYVKFPDRTTATGQMINSYLQGDTEQSDEAIHLLFSANRWEAVQGILQDLESGCTVVVDRYSFSGAVYSAAKDKPNMSVDWCWNMEVGLPQPDLVLFLDISTENAAKRGGYGAERYEKEEIQVKVRGLFKSLFSRLPKVSVKVVDAGLSLEEVAEEIWQAYEGLNMGKEPSRSGTLPALSTPSIMSQLSSSLSSMTTSSISATH